MRTIFESKLRKLLVVMVVCGIGSIVVQTYNLSEHTSNYFSYYIDNGDSSFEGYTDTAIGKDNSLPSLNMLHLTTDDGLKFQSPSVDGNNTLQMTPSPSLAAVSTATPTKNNNGKTGHTNNVDNPFWSATECRKEIESQHYVLYDNWLLDQVPILHYATTISQTTYILFITSHLQEFKKKFHNSNWYCSNNTAANLESDANAIGINRSGRSGFIVVKCAHETNLNTIYSSLPSNRSGEITFYNISTLLYCDELEEKMHVTYNESIMRTSPAPPLSSLSLQKADSTQGDDALNHKQKKEVRFGACTMIQGSTSHERLHQWIEYHRMIGMEHFWVFMNEPWPSSLSPSIQSQLQHLPYITFIPYNFDIKPHYNYTTYRHTFIFIQVPMQMQCLYMMKKYNLEWVTTTDVDEYILVTQNDTRNDTEASNFTTNNSDEPELQRLISSIPKHEEIGGLCLNSIPFGRNVPIEPKDKPFPLLIDYTWRDEEDPWKKAFRHYKFIYNPRLVQDLGVHYLYRGGKEIRLDVKNQARINHYKNPDAGVYMIEKKYDRYKNDTTLFDRYRQRLMKILKNGTTIN